MPLQTSGSQLSPSVGRSRAGEPRCESDVRSGSHSPVSSATGAEQPSLCLGFFPRSANVVCPVTVNDTERPVPRDVTTPWKITRPFHPLSSLTCLRPLFLNMPLCVHVSSTGGKNSPVPARLRSYRTHTAAGFRPQYVLLCKWI